MSWVEVWAAYRGVAAARDAGRPFAAPWQAFRDTVRGQAAPPYHLRGLLAAIGAEAGRGPRAELRILDHGCGGALTCLYLLTLGYEGVHGVDVGGNCETWNRLLREEFGIAEARFRVYDGHTLPLADDSIDVAFSQQVLEHVTPAAIDSYYAEEGRVLKGGVAIHQVPHRLVPYDTRTRTWLVHWLPRPLALRAYARLGRDAGFVANHLHLRSPAAHRRRTRAHIGACRDLTVQRLTDLTALDYYDGSLRLRRPMARLAGLPAVGGAIALALRNFVMIDTIARKPPRGVTWQGVRERGLGGAESARSGKAGLAQGTVRATGALAVETPSSLRGAERRSNPVWRSSYARSRFGWLPAALRSRSQ